MCVFLCSVAVVVALCVRARPRACVFVRACVRACVCVCVCARARACMCLYGIEEKDVE